MAQCVAFHNSTDVSANDYLAQCISITVDDHLQTSVGTDIGRAEPAFRRKDGLEVLPSPIFIILCLFSCLVFSFFVCLQHWMSLSAPNHHRFFLWCPNNELLSCTMTSSYFSPLFIIISSAWDVLRKMQQAMINHLVKLHSNSSCCWSYR